jgi:heme exporter protein D
MTNFLAMGGYAAYVWPAYAVTVLALVGMMVASLQSLRHRQRLLAALEAVQPSRPLSRRTRDDTPA